MAGPAIPGEPRRVAAGANRPSRIASARAVVSASGATPSSESRIRTHSRYCCSAAAGSPAAASADIKTTWAGSCSASSSQPALGRPDGRRPGLHRCPTPGEPLERPRQLAAVRLGLGRLPGVELAGAHDEAGHELSPVERHRRVERVEALGARARGVVVMATDSGEGSAEAPRVDLELLRTKADRAPVDLQSDPAECGPEHRERASERAVRAGFVRLGPEQRCQCLAAGRPTAHREVGEQGSRLARVHHERGTVDLDSHGAEQLKAESGRHGDTVQAARDSRNVLCLLRLGAP